MQEVKKLETLEYVYDSEEERGQHILSMLKEGWQVGEQVKQSLAYFGVKSQHSVWYARFYKEDFTTLEGEDFYTKLYNMELQLIELSKHLRDVTGWGVALTIGQVNNTLSGMSLEEANAFIHLYKADMEKKITPDLVTAFKVLIQRGKLVCRDDVWYTSSDVNGNYGIGEFK